MTRTASIVIFTVLTMVCASCKLSGPEKHRIQEYYNLDSLLSMQIIRLTDNNARLYKRATVNGSAEETQMQPDSTGWARELALFREADLNKPAFSKAYSVTKAQKDTRSNLLFDKFTPVNNDELRIRSIQIYYLNDLSNIRKIEIVKKEENELFYSSLHMALNFGQLKKEVVLQSYVVNGLQKLRLKDTVSYTVEARIEYR
jgi:hypothetical protein